MKKTLLVSIIAFVAVSLVGLSSATAQEGDYGMAGCGLGSIVMGPGGGIMQIFAATTNGTFASQTFGITTGTSNCVEKGTVAADAEQEAFFETNMDHLRADMASGGGEYMTAFGALLGCDADVQDDLNSFAQTNYSSVFPTEQTTAQQALYTFKLQVSQQDGFAQSCNRL